MPEHAYNTQPTVPLTCYDPDIHLSLDQHASYAFIRTLRSLHVLLTVPIISVLNLKEDARILMLNNYSGKVN